MQYIAVIGSGLGVLGATLGVGMIFACLMLGISRNPSAGGVLQKSALVGAALAEGLGILSLLVAILVLFR